VCTLWGDALAQGIQHLALALVQTGAQAVQRGGLCVTQPLIERRVEQHARGIVHMPLVQRPIAVLQAVLNALLWRERIKMQLIKHASHANVIAHLLIVG
jgi:hypothetical protein